MPSLVLFACCFVGFFRDLSTDGPLLLPLRSCMSAFGSQQGMIFVRSANRSFCVAAQDEKRLQDISQVCDLSLDVLGSVKPEDSLYFVSEGIGGCVPHGFPVPLLVATGRTVYPKDMKEMDWAWVPGIGPAISQRIHRWHLGVMEQGGRLDPCALEEVSGVGPGRAGKIRSFLGMGASCVGERSLRR